MRLEVLHVAGAIPVRRRGVIDVAALPARARKAVEGAVGAILAAQGRPAASAPSTRGRIPDVGSATITIVQDDGETTQVTFSDAEATREQAGLLQELRPYLAIVPWR